jgi:hypothetical protein|tara:strand:- start:6326 stop:6637 length:312 start_codon:yes stop_codon:yes gene_type:complete
MCIALGAFNRAVSSLYDVARVPRRRVAVRFRARDFQICNLSLGGRSIARVAESRGRSRAPVERAMRGDGARASARRRGRVRFGVRAAANGDAKDRRKEFQKPL